jgi:hypothetical protein
MFLLSPFLAAAQNTVTDAKTGMSPLFSSHNLLEIRIEAPLSQLIRERPDKDYLDGKLSYADAEGVAHSFDLKLRTRGKYRNQKRTCVFAPVRLNFRKKQVVGTEFAGQDKLKLITHCKSNSNRHEQLVLKEYLAYRSLQVLTDKSFGARLLRITYVDSDNELDTITRFGFVIEDADDIGDRINLAPAKVPKISYEDLDRQQSNLVSVFQYMIGNTDYSMIRGPLNANCCHNIGLFVDNDGLYTPIPYDFDFAGMVNAPYAEPNPKLGISSVRVRFYRGRCDNNELLPGTVAYIKEHETEILGLARELDGFEENYQQDVIRYLNVYFERVSTPQNIERYLARKCS